MTTDHTSSPHPASPAGAMSGRFSPVAISGVHINFTKLADQTAAMFALAIPQDRTERILLDAIGATGLVDVCFATELLSFEQDTTGVHLRTRTADTETTLADVRIDPELDRTDEWPTILDHRGIVVGIRFGDQVWRIIEQAVDERLSGPALDDHIVTLAQELFGPGSVEVLWRSAYHKHERCAHRFRHGRITLAGDAGHLNSPAGGQGMNSGIQDAHNLAWKLPAVVTIPDADVDALLES